VQMKCTSRDILREAHLGFPLEIKNYNDLRHPDPLTPCILVVVVVPNDINEWLTHSESDLTLRRCGYWISLRGEPDISNSVSVTVNIPRTQVLTPDSLRAMMVRINDGGVP
jgi:hypothetical protein